MGLGDGFKGVCQECEKETTVFPLYRNGRTAVLCWNCFMKKSNEVVVK